MKTIILSFVCVLLLNACDNSHQQYFHVENTIDTSIVFYYDAGESIDSTATIPPQTTQTIYRYGAVFGSVGVKDERYNDPIRNLRIGINDTIIAISEDLWQFRKDTKYIGHSTIVIDSTLLP